MGISAQIKSSIYREYEEQNAVVTEVFGPNCSQNLMQPPHLPKRPHPKRVPREIEPHNLEGMSYRPNDTFTIASRNFSRTTTNEICWYVIPSKKQCTPNPCKRVTAYINVLCLHCSYSHSPMNQE